jgi:hypothetical protein
MGLRYSPRRLGALKARTCNAVAIPNWVRRSSERHRITGQGCKTGDDEGVRLIERCVDELNNVSARCPLMTLAV